MLRIKLHVIETPDDLLNIAEFVNVVLNSNSTILVKLSMFHRKTCLIKPSQRKQSFGIVLSDFRFM
jgi:hypothetical protein